MNRPSPAAPCVGNGPPTHACPLCGARFRLQGEVCKGCRLAGKAKGRVCCPGCGHIFPERSYLFDLVMRWFRNKE
jgi:predicted amidophosphoribosyltransferase